MGNHKVFHTPKEDVSNPYAIINILSKMKFSSAVDESELGYQVVN